MREIDTDALLGVAPSLGIGNPATATRQVVFDDETLQQVWSAEKFARLPAVTVTFRNTISAAANNTERGTLTFAEMFNRGEYDALLSERGLTPRTADVYLVGFQMQTPDDSNLDDCGFAVRPYVPEQSNPNAQVLAEGTGALGVAAVQAGGNFPITNNLEPEDYQNLLPMKLSGGIDGPDADVIFMMVTSGAGGATLVAWRVKLHFCLKDVPLWYVL